MARTLRFSGVTLIVRATDDDAVATADSIATALNDLHGAGNGEFDVELTVSDPDRPDEDQERALFAIVEFAAP